MYGAYIIPEKYRGKNLELPQHKGQYVDNNKIILNIPQNAFYLDILPVQDTDKEEIQDDDEGDPLLRYFNSDEALITFQDNLLNFSMLSLEKRLRLIFERKD